MRVYDLQTIFCTSVAWLMLTLTSPYVGSGFDESLMSNMDIGVCSNRYVVVSGACCTPYYL